MGLLNLAPVIGGGLLLSGYGSVICCDPMLARSMLRLTSVTMALNGGIHFGLGASFYETEKDVEISKATKTQLVFSFVPAIAATYLTSVLLMGPLSPAVISSAFINFGIVNAASLGFDFYQTSNNRSPKWYLKLRILTFFLQSASLALLYMYFSSKGTVDLPIDRNRMEGLKQRRELEREDEEKMIEEVDEDESVFVELEDDE